jgi:hypothetical protein
MSEIPEPVQDSFFSQHQRLIPVILATWEAGITRIICSRPAWENSLRDPHLRITREKWTGGVPQAIAHLDKSSNPSPAKKIPS